jgi:hypothetical protein
VSGEKMILPELCINLHHYEIEWNGENLVYYQYCLDSDGEPVSIDPGGKEMESDSYKSYLSCSNGQSQTSGCSVGFNALSGSTIDNEINNFYILIDGCKRKIEVGRNGNITIKSCD